MQPHMTPSFAAVCFDLDDTLLEYNQDGTAVWSDVLEIAGVDRFCSHEAAWECADDVPDADSDHHFLTQMFEIAAERHDGPAQAATQLADAYEVAVDHTDVSFRPGAEAALRLASDHGPVGLVTNGGRDTQTTKLDALGIHDHFETHVYAGEMTPPKPAPEPFDHAVADLGTTHERTLYVGNSLQHDVAGAKTAGLPVAWFPREDDRDGHGGDGAIDDSVEHTPDFTFETLHELEQALE